MNKITQFYWRFIASPLAYARHIGVKIGEHCLIGTRGWSTEPYLITIGNHVQITTGVLIHTHGAAHVARSSFPQFDTFGKVVIKDWSYIGSNSIILPGVTIGEGTLVAAGSVVTKSHPPHSVLAGNPAKVICSVDDYIKRNLRYNVNTKRMSNKEKRDFLLSLPEDKFIRK